MYKFGVPQGSILGSVLFNLCAVDLKNILDGSECVQYVDDSMIYGSCKIKNVNKCSNKIESELKPVEVRWKGMNLVFNPHKTKVMVISSRQMAQYNQLHNSHKVNIKCNNKNIERIKEYKPLCIVIDEHFVLHSHVKRILKDGYSTLRTLKLLKSFTAYYIMKVRLLQQFIENITSIFKKKKRKRKKKIEWRNFYNPVQFSLNANADAKMTL